MSSANVVVDIINWCIACAAPGSTAPAGVAVAGGVIAVAVAFLGATPTTGKESLGADGTGSTADDHHEGLSSFDYGDREEEPELD